MSNVLAGFLAGIVTITYSLSYAVFIFSGHLAPQLHMGLQSALLSGCIVAWVVACFSSFRFAIAGPDSNAAALLALIVASTAQKLPLHQPEHTWLPTLWMALALSSIITGLLLFVLGHMKLGRLIRFIPYPVVGGFLAATGWLLFQGSFKVMCGIPLTFANIEFLFEGHAFEHCLVGLGFAFILLLVMRKWKHFLLLPSMLTLAVGSVYLVLYTLDIPLATARAEGWFFRPLPNASFSAWHSLSWSQVDGWLLLEQVTNLLAMVAVVTMTLLLNASGLELATDSDVDFDRELQTAGAANLLTGLLGGMVGYLSISRSLLNREAGGTHRISGCIAGSLCLVVLLWGGSILSFVPKPLLGGLLCYLGLALLAEWLIDAQKKLSRFDYMLVLSILLFVSIWDFLTAVGLGTVIACLLFAFNYSRIRVVKHAMSCREHRSNVVRSLASQQILEEEGERIGIFCLQGFIFFGTVSHLVQEISKRIRDPERKELDFLILDFRLVNGLDSSAALSFLKLRRMAEKSSFMLVFSHVEEAFQKQLKQSDCIVEEDPHCKLFLDLDRALEFCEDEILRSIRSSADVIASVEISLKTLLGSPDDLPRLIPFMERIQLAQGEILFHAGQKADALYVIERGSLSVFLHQASGQKKRLASMGAGTIVGEMGLFLERTRTASVRTETPVVLYRLHREQWVKMQVSDPALAMAFQHAIIRMLSKRLIRANQELDVLFK